MRPPVCIDLCCGIGGWASGFLAAGYRVIGFDVRTFKQGYPGDLVLQDIRTLDGRQFRDATVIVASPPCNEFALWDKPSWFWRNGRKDPAMDLVESCFRIRKEANVPTVIENVRGAQKFIGSAECRFGSFYLWGDVPLLRPAMKFVKGAYTGDSARRAKRNGTLERNTGSAVSRAKIPFDLAHWLAQEFLRMRASA